MAIKVSIAKVGGGVFFGSGGGECVECVHLKYAGNGKWVMKTGGGLI